MTRTPWQCGVAILGVLLFSHAAAAQGVGAIGGTVVDESGAVLPGVTMTLIEPRDDWRQSDHDYRLPWCVSIHEARSWTIQRSCRVDRVQRHRARGHRRQRRRDVARRRQPDRRHRQRTGARHIGCAGTGYDQRAGTDRLVERNARYAAESQRRVGHRARHPRCRPRQGRRRRLGSVPAVVDHRSWQCERKRLHDRRDGDLQQYGKRDGCDALSRPVRIPGDQLSDRQRSRGTFERRRDLQPGHQVRYEQPARRLHGQRGQPCDGVGQLLRRS